MCPNPLIKRKYNQLNQNLMYPTIQKIFSPHQHIAYQYSNNQRGSSEHLLEMAETIRR